MTLLNLENYRIRYFPKGVDYAPVGTLAEIQLNGDIKPFWYQRIA